MKIRLDSILVRIVLLQMATLLVIAAALYGASLWLLDSDVVRFERRSLQYHAERVASRLKLEPDGSVRAELRPRFREFYAHGLGGIAYAITDADGTVLDSSREPERLEMMGDPKGTEPVYFQSPHKRRSYLGVSIPAKVGGKQVWVQITRQIRHPDMVTGDVATYFLGRIGWYAIPIVLLVFALSILVVRHMLRPLIKVSGMAGAIGPDRLDKRLPVEALPQEIVPLVKAINASLANLERGFHFQREFTAHAAHELRTPLSILRMQIDNLADQNAAASLREDVDAMGHVVDQLLHASEFEGMTVRPEESADLHKICCDVLAFMAPVALADGKDLALEGAEVPVIVKGSEHMLYQAIRNLVENALKYSPAGSCIEVDVNRNGAVRVLDRGAGVPQDQRELIFRRFWRGDRTRTDGAGLGLAIVARVAEAHGGTVSVEDRPGGGAVFCLDLQSALQPAHRGVANGPSHPDELSANRKA